MFIYPLSRKQYVFGMMIARTSNEISQINNRMKFLGAMLGLYAEREG